MKACEENGRAAADHFVRSYKMIELGKGGQRKTEDILLSRYATYLVVMNSDSKLPIVATEAAGTESAALTLRRNYEWRRIINLDLTGPAMDIELNKSIVNTYIELWSTGNLALADEILAANYIDHTHPQRAPGPESVKQEVKAFREGFPDARISVEQMIAEGEMVAFRFILRGTHLGMFAGFPPTGTEKVLMGADFIRIVNGKMVELWSSQDTLNWVQQLGFKLAR